MKMEINSGSTTLTLVAPTSAGQSINYILEAAFQEIDANPVVLPYYNASNPSQTFSGPGNSGSPQNTSRIQRVQLQLEPGLPGNTGSQTTPAADSGWIGLSQISVSFGQTQIACLESHHCFDGAVFGLEAPIAAAWRCIRHTKLYASGNFIVPAGVTQVEVEVWGGGQVTSPLLPDCRWRRFRWRLRQKAESRSNPRPGGPGHCWGRRVRWHYRWRQRQTGGTSSFGQFVSATGGALNYLATTAAPQNGSTPPGVRVGGDVNFAGSAGQAGLSNQGGLGGAAPIGGAQNSGTTGMLKLPRGRAAGAGTGPVAMWLTMVRTGRRWLGGHQMVVPHHVHGGGNLNIPK